MPQAAGVEAVAASSTVVALPVTVVPIRRGFTLGGSEIPAVLGLDPYTSPYALAVRKLEGREVAESQAMRLGTLLQAAHLGALEDDGYTVIPAPADGFQHPALPWLVGHPDGFVALNGERAPVELKLRGVHGSDALRDCATVQALVYAELVASSRALVSELHGGYGGMTRDEWVVDADAELFAVIVERCEAFLSLIRRGVCPAPDGSESTRDALRARFTGEAGTRVRLTRAGWEHLLRVRELDYTIATAKVQRERHAQEVQAEMGNAVEAISPHDTLAARWKVVTSHRVDTTALKKDHPALASAYSTTTTSRRFEANP